MVGFILCLLLFVLVLTCRVQCNRCGAAYKHMRITQSSGRLSLVILAIGAAAFFVSAGLASVGNMFVL